MLTGIIAGTRQQECLCILEYLPHARCQTYSIASTTGETVIQIQIDENALPILPNTIPADEFRKFYIQLLADLEP